MNRLSYYYVVTAILMFRTVVIAQQPVASPNWSPFAPASLEQQEGMEEEQPPPTKPPTKRPTKRPTASLALSKCPSVYSSSQNYRAKCLQAMKCKFGKLTCCGRVAYSQYCTCAKGGKYRCAIRRSKPCPKICPKRKTRKPTSHKKKPTKSPVYNGGYLYTCPNSAFYARRKTCRVALKCPYSKVDMCCGKPRYSTQCTCQVGSRLSCVAVRLAPCGKCKTSPIRPKRRPTKKPTTVYNGGHMYECPNSYFYARRRTCRVKLECPYHQVDTCCGKPRYSVNCTCDLDQRLSCASITLPACPDSCKKNKTKPPTQAPISMAPPTRITPSTPSPTPLVEQCQCKTPKTVPTKCELQILMDMMEITIKKEPRLSSQWLRLAFHDAGTFNRRLKQGGANGCLINLVKMRDENENLHLDLPIVALEVIQKNWQRSGKTCVQVSAADMIQFAGLFSGLRQVTSTVMPPTSKLQQLQAFSWGRPDEQHCQTEWARNLPGFQLGNDAEGIAFRCLMAGVEIKEKMMDRNGFTAEEATVLIGSHTIGLSRNSFGRSFAAPWVTNGADNAVPGHGPVFDNSYFQFLDSTVQAKTASEFTKNHAPFTKAFPDWMRDSMHKVNHLDTDVVLAFPTQDVSLHPDYHQFTKAFAKDNSLFLDKFFKAMDKMGKLGVVANLSPASICTPCVPVVTALPMASAADSTTTSDNVRSKINLRSSTTTSATEVSKNSTEWLKVFNSELDRAKEDATEINKFKQEWRKDEIARLTKPLDEPAK